MSPVPKRPLPLRKRFPQFLRQTFLTKAYRLRQDQKKVEREFNEALKKARTTGKREDVYEVKNRYQFDLQYYSDQQEVLFTEKLLKNANRLRIHIPPKPNFTEEEGFEENEDWEMGTNEFYLTNKGINKVEEEIQKKERWKRERRLFWFQCVTTVVTVIGTVSGWVAFYFK